ncbi:MAG: hypothetical protein V1809_13780 [Planctomycetota bacterium]
MNILIDECLPRYLKIALSDFSRQTVQEAGWSSVKNGPLLNLAEAAFDVFLTADQNLQYQQNLKCRKIAIIVLPSSRLPVVKKYESELKQIISKIKPGDFIELKDLS